jgi:hypothetical protein
MSSRAELFVFSLAGVTVCGGAWWLYRQIQSARKFDALMRDFRFIAAEGMKINKK